MFDVIITNYVNYSLRGQLLWYRLSNRRYSQPALNLAQFFVPKDDASVRYHGLQRGDTYLISMFLNLLDSQTSF